FLSSVCTQPIEVCAPSRRSADRSQQHREDADSEDPECFAISPLETVGLIMWTAARADRIRSVRRLRLCASQRVLRPSGKRVLRPSGIGVSDIFTIPRVSGKVSVRKHKLEI